jgi:hypothetical protein
MANNDALYDAVMAGAGGAAQRGWLIATNAGAYVTFAADVDILAVAVDLQIPPIAGGPSISQINLLQSITEAVLSARYPITNIPATYIDIAKAIAALYNALTPFLKNKPTIIQNILAGTGITVSIVNGVATIGATAPIWQTMWNIDFTTQPNQALNVDGVYSIGGRNWSVENSANTYAGSAGMRIINGTGLALPCQAAAGNYWPQYRLAPMIGTLIDALITQNAPVILSIEQGASVGWGHELFFGAEYPSTPNRTNIGMRLGTASGTSVFQTWGCWKNNTATYANTISSISKVYANNNIAQMIFRSGLSNFATFDATSGISADGDWNDPQNLAILQTINWIDYTTTPGLPVTKVITDIRTWNFFLANHAGSLGAGYEQVVRKAKCLVLR